jgi:hypothetical protein
MAKTKQQKELVVLITLVVVAALLWFFYYGPRANQGASFAGNGAYTPINAQDYSTIITDLTKTQNTEYKSNGRNIFVSTPIPVEEAKTGPAKAAFTVYNRPSLPPPPPPADLPMKFFGYGALPSGGPRQAFLQDANGDDVHIVSEGEVVLNHIRILHIGNDKIEFEDTATGQKGSKAMEAIPAA